MINNHNNQYLFVFIIYIILLNALTFNDGVLTIIFIFLHDSSLKQLSCIIDDELSNVILQDHSLQKLALFINLINFKQKNQTSLYDL